MKYGIINVNSLFGVISVFTLVDKISAYAILESSSSQRTGTMCTMCTGRDHSGCCRWTTGDLFSQ